MGGKYALLIGNSKYDDSGLAGLRAPDADVRAFEEVLRSPEICEFNDVVTLIDQGLAEVLRQITRFFSKRRRDDLLLLYFSGHGVKDDAGQLYLAVRDTERALLAGTAVPSHFVSSQMDACNSRSLVMMLDCCNSGAFAAGSKSSGSVDTRAAFEGNGAGRIVLTATDSTQYAWEGDRVIGEEAENSLFTHFIVEGLRTGAADRDEDGFINVDELYDFVFEQIQQQTHKQTPKKCVYNAHGEFRIAKNCSPKAIALPPDLVGRAESPNRAVALEAVPEVEIHLKNIGRMAAAEELLGRLRTGHDSNAVRQAAAAAMHRHTAWKRLHVRELTEALTAIQDALALEPHHKGAMGLRDTIAQAIVAERREAIAAAASEIRASLSKDDLDGAADSLTRADKELETPPELASLRDQVTRRLEERRVRDEAVGLHVEVAQLAIADERFGEALETLQKAAALDPKAIRVAELRTAAENGARFRQVDRLLRNAESFRTTNLETALFIVQSAVHLAPDYHQAVALHAEIAAAAIARAASEIETLLSTSNSSDLDQALSILRRVDSEMKRPPQLDGLRQQVTRAVEQSRVRDAQVATHLEAARSAIDHGLLDVAGSELDVAASLEGRATDLAALRARLEDARTAAEEAERLRRIDETLDAAERLHASDVAEAVQLVDGVLAEDPEHGRARHLRGELSVTLDRQQRLAVVAEEFNRQLSFNEVSAAAQVLAGAELDLQPYLESQRLQLEETLRLRNEAVAAHLADAHAATADRRFDAAVAALDAASRLNPHADGLDPAFNAAQRGREVDALLRDARQLREKGQLHDAGAIVDEALRLDSRDAEAIALGIAVRKEIAERHELRRRRLDAVSDEIATFLSELKLEAAADALTRAEVELDDPPELERFRLELTKEREIAATLRRAKDLLTTGRPAEASAVVDDVLRARPQHGVALGVRQRIQEEIEQGRLAAIAAEQREAERLAVEQREAARIAAEQREAERLAAEQREAERLAAEQRKVERLAAEQREADWLAAEQREAERLAAARRETEEIAGNQRGVREGRAHGVALAAAAAPGTAVTVPEPPTPPTLSLRAHLSSRFVEFRFWVKIGAPLALLVTIGIATQWPPGVDVAPPSQTSPTPPGVVTPVVSTVQPAPGVEPSPATPVGTPTDLTPGEAPQSRAAGGNIGRAATAPAPRLPDAASGPKPRTNDAPKVITERPTLPAVPAASRPNEPAAGVSVPAKTPPEVAVGNAPTSPVPPMEPPSPPAASSKEPSNVATAVPPVNPVRTEPNPVRAEAVPPPSDTLLIRNVLRQYEAAYGQRDASAIRALWPDVPASTLNEFAKSFSQWRSAAMDLGEPALTINGATAVATSAATVSFVPKVGRATEQRINATFRLRKVADTWVIERFEAKVR